MYLIRNNLNNYIHSQVYLQIVAEQSQQHNDTHKLQDSIIFPSLPDIVFLSVIPLHLSNDNQKYMGHPSYNVPTTWQTLQHSYIFSRCCHGLWWNGMMATDLHNSVSSLFWTVIEWLFAITMQINSVGWYFCSSYKSW